MTRSYLAKQVQDIKPSGIRKFFDLASKMDNVISLGVGEPDFVTPWNVIEASYHSLEQGYTAYTANAGLLELREEISKYLYETFNVSYNPENQLLVTVGASQAIDVALRTILDQGDEVIIVEPCFVSYGPAVSLAGGVPVSVSATADNAFKITPEQVEAAITPRTKAIVLCSPNNPTGAVLSKEELTAVAKVIEKHDLVVLSDEIYAELSYDELASSMAAIEGMKERTIVISGFSKAFAMTGWRLGYVAGPVEILAAMTKIHQYTIMCAPTMAQHGALEALRNGNDSVREMKTSYRQRRNFVVKALNEMGLSCHLPGGAFYVFPSIQSTGFSSEEFAQKLLEEERVAVVPGHVFGESGEGYIRCSYATSIKQLDEAMKRMERFVNRHSKMDEPTV
ncbi:aminotransferase [Gracilibacillus salinarum]|uniref:Aminotransferase n=1 Tax=Gracilibacillus salinarum TaxID=2932255 RepID=A0ABY4GSU8_9BACI|nr:aminotransferase [Gracilibacillus salinarum]UOQ87349.1 aminotransferase [Gracilibacillus salinarum]